LSESTNRSTPPRHANFREEVGVTGIYLEQLYTFGAPERDPRGRVISVAYFALIDAERQQIVRGVRRGQVRSGTRSSTARLAPGWHSITARFSIALSGDSKQD
jgi:ADP-ribose pyrophosphatase YjhB (NUDIX family)